MERKGGALVEVSKLDERKDEIVDAVMLLNLAGELAYSNPEDALRMINKVKARGLKEVSYIADVLGETVEDWMQEMNQMPDTDPGVVLKFERPLH